MTPPQLSIRHVIVQLVRGPLYREDASIWSRLLHDLDQVEHHFYQMGLELVFDEEAGYAFLRNQASAEEDAEDAATGEAPLPRLLRRNPLSYLHTVLLTELRERLLRHDQSTDGTDFLYLEFKDILEFMRPYCGETGNEQKVVKKVAGAVSKLDNLSVLRKVQNRSEVIYRVEPILRAKLPVDQIKAIRDRLKAHLGQEDASTDDAPELDDEETSE